MYGELKEELKEKLEEIKEEGTYKEERIIVSDQDANIEVQDGKDVINFCANNYLGLANNSELIKAAKEGLESHGLGLASVRFICGTQDVHKKLESKIADFLKTDDTILYTSCFDANGGLFESFLDENCAVISDELNHASIIDGIRLCKADRYVFKHSDMKDLEEQLKEAQDARICLIATDGVFSMDGDIADLEGICDLAEQYGALVMVDDSHATGFMGENGRGTPEYCGVEGRIDIITSTLGKALGGASGGFTTGRQEIVDILRQRSRPYLFSNTIPPVIIHSALKCFDMLSESTELRDKLMDNTRYFRDRMTREGFDIRPGKHPIVPIMLGEAKLAQEYAADLLEKDVYVIGFSYPVVPKGEARIRVQLSAAHSKDHLDRAIEAFIEIGRKKDVIS